jgi:hypothetical protein
MLLDHFRFASEMPVMLLAGGAKLSAKPPPAESPAANATAGRVVPR